MTAFFVFLFIFLSRILFLSISPAFYDSLEYLRLFELSSLIEALKQAHNPIHPLWITVGWLFNKIPISTTFYKIEFLNAVLGTLSCFLIYKIGLEFTDKKKALIIALFSAFIPFFWLSQTNVLYEPLLGVLLLGSFWILAKAEGKEGNRRIRRTRCFYSGLFLAGAVLVSSTALVYLIFFAGYALGKKRLGRLGLLGGLGIFLSFLGYLSILRLRGIPAGEIFSVLSSSNNILEKIKIEGFLFFLRGIRNSTVVYFNYLTVPVGVVLGYLSTLSCLRGKRRGLIISWIISFFLLNSFWHAGMFGRLSLILILAPVFLLLKINNKYLIICLFVYLIIFSSLKVIPYSYKKIPYILEKEYFQQLGEDFLLIASNYEEPYLKDFKVLVLSSPKTDLEKIRGELEEKLKDGELVLITSQALSTPYFQYDGMDYQILSKKKKYSKTQGQILINDYKLEPIAEWDGYNLQIFKISNRAVFVKNTI